MILHSYGKHSASQLSHPYIPDAQDTGHASPAAENPLGYKLDGRTKRLSIGRELPAKHMQQGTNFPSFDHDLLPLSSALVKMVTTHPSSPINSFPVWFTPSCSRIGCFLGQNHLLNPALLFIPPVILKSLPQHPFILANTSALIFFEYPRLSF